MKKCTWCGKEYPDAAERCLIDDEPLASKEPAAAEQSPRDGLANRERPLVCRPHMVDLGADWRPKFIDLGQLERAFDFDEGFSRPNWPGIAAAIRQTVSAENAPAAWTEAAIQWTLQIAANLGGGYGIRCSGEFILLSDWKYDTATDLLIFAERTLQEILAWLQDAAWRPKYGKHVVLLFTEDDDYYQYVSYFHRDGVRPASGGCLIRREYVHIAMPCRDGKHIHQALVHELVHNSVAHLSLPLWLSEISLRSLRTPTRLMLARPPPWRF